MTLHSQSSKLSVNSSPLRAENPSGSEPIASLNSRDVSTYAPTNKPLAQQLRCRSCPMDAGQIGYFRCVTVGQVSQFINRCPSSHRSPEASAFGRPIIGARAVMPESDLPNDIGGQWSDVFDWPIIGIQVDTDARWENPDLRHRSARTARRRTHLRRLGSSDEYPLHAAEQDADRHVLLGSDRRSFHRRHSHFRRRCKAHGPHQHGCRTTSTCSTTAI